MRTESLILVQFPVIFPRSPWTVPVSGGVLINPHSVETEYVSAIDPLNVPSAAKYKSALTSPRGLDHFLVKEFDYEALRSILK